MPNNEIDNASLSSHCSLLLWSLEQFVFPKVNQLSLVLWLEFHFHVMKLLALFEISRQEFRRRLICLSSDHPQHSTNKQTNNLILLTHDSFIFVEVETDITWSGLKGRVKKDKD